MRQNALALFSIERSFAVKFQRGVGNPRRRNGIIHCHIIAANNPAQCNFMFVAVLPNRLRALDNHIIIRQDFDDGNGYLSAESVRIKRGAVRLPIIGAARRKSFYKIKNTRARRLPSRILNLSGTS